MSSGSIIRILLLVIPAAWIVFRLMPVERSRYDNPRIMAQEAQEQPSHREPDKFVSHESVFKSHYQSHYTASGFAYPHYRLAYKYGFDLALDPDNQNMDWKNIEPQARRNWDERTLGQWSLHSDAVLYGWEEGIKQNGR